MILNELKEVKKEIYFLNSRLNKLIESHKISHLEISDKEILKLPKHLQVTLLALNQINGKGTATQVSLITKKPRATESSYLNQLERMGLVISERVNRNKYFFLKK